MKNQRWIEENDSTFEDRREYEKERFILWTTCRVCELMDEAGVSRADLARSLGTSRAYITALLSGSRNMTLRTLADICAVLGYRAEVTVTPLRPLAESMSDPVQAEEPVKASPRPRSRGIVRPVARRRKTPV